MATIVLPNARTMDKVRDACEFAINASVGEIEIRPRGEFKPDLRIYLSDWQFGNFCDAHSLMSLLVRLKKIGVAAEDAETMWLGVETDRSGKEPVLRCFVWVPARRDLVKVQD